MTHRSPTYLVTKTPCLQSTLSRWFIMSTQFSTSPNNTRKENMTIKVPSLESDTDYRAAKLLEQKLRSERDAAKVEALRLKALENFKYDDPDNRARIARIAAGETVEDEDEADNEELSRRASNRWSDLSDACDLHGKHMRNVNYSASKNICAKLKPEHDALMKRLFAGLVEIHNA